MNKTFKQRCDDLGRTEQDVYKIAMDVFEPHKKDFAEDAVAPMLIVIGGGPGKESSSWTIQITWYEHPQSRPLESFADICAATR